MILGAVLDHVILTSDPPGMVGGIAMPEQFGWRQATGTVLASNSEDIPVGAKAWIYPGAGERLDLGRGEFVRVVEEWDVIAILAG